MSSSPLTLSIGFMGMALSFTYRIPQMIKLYKTRSYKDISLWMIHIQNLSYVCYITYAVMIDDIVNLASSALSLLQNVLILCMIKTMSTSTEKQSEPT